MPEFDRSSFIRERHASARAQREFFRQETGRDLPHSEFLKNDNALTQSIVVYDVSFQLDYSSPSNALRIKGDDTFRIYTIRSPQTEEMIIMQTKEAVQNLSAPQTGNGFNSGAQTVIDKDLRVDLDQEMRGIEQLEGVEFTRNVADGIARNGVFIERRDQSAVVSNRAGSTAKMRTDLSLYFR